MLQRERGRPLPPQPSQQSLVYMTAFWVGETEVGGALGGSQIQF